MAPPAPNLGVLQALKGDKNDPNLNLGVGAYRTKELQPYVLSVLNKVILIGCTICLIVDLPVFMFSFACYRLKSLCWRKETTKRYNDDQNISFLLSFML